MNPFCKYPIEETSGQISTIPGLPPFPAAMSDHVGRYRPPQPDDAVANGNRPGITGLKTFHVLRHEKGKWHFLVPCLMATLLQLKKRDQQRRSIPYYPNIRTV